MDQILENDVKNEANAGQINKTWSFIEETNKHTVNHTFTIKGNKFSHISELKEAAQAFKQRTDINISNVISVNSFYGVTKNIVAAVICAIIALLSLIGGIMQFGGEDGIGLAIVFIVIAVVFGLLAYLFFTRIKPAFVLEIEVPLGSVAGKQFAFGNAVINLSKKGLKGNKYKFKMDQQTGIDIIDTIGEYIIKE